MTTRKGADEHQDLVLAKKEQINDGTAPSVSVAGSTSWSRSKDPRIVRVSRAFGGKDRHSKVCTVRGLRDRRVRLSVPTAIQLYDLQDRLGLNQPSKVVDWLLNVAKNEIDELPPLPSIPTMASFSNNLGQTIVPSVHHNLTRELPSGSGNAVDSSEEKENYGSGSNSSSQNAYFSSNNFFSRMDHSSSSSSSSLGLMNSSAMPFGSLMRWDPSQLSLSQSGMAAVPNQEGHHDFPSFGLVPSLIPTQVLHGYHQSHVTQPYFPATADYSGGGRQFHFLGTATKLNLPQDDHHHHDQEKGDENGFLNPR